MRGMLSRYPSYQPPIMKTGIRIDSYRLFSAVRSQNGPVALLRLVRQHPRRLVEALREVPLVEHVLGRAGHRVGEVLAHLPRVDVHDPVHEVHVVLVEVVGRVDRDDRLETRAGAASPCDRVEPSPGDAEHPDAPVRERLLRRARR
jgi:hypothetical protein